MTPKPKPKLRSEPIASAPPLARLFAIAYRSLIDDLHDELRARGWVDVRPAFGFVLLAAAAGPTTATELAALTGTSKQAASKLVEAMEGAGYIRREPGDTDGRRRLVLLTERGRDLLDEVEAIYRDLEDGWADVLGRRRLEQLRVDLTTVLADDQGVLPPVRPSL